MRRHMTMLLGMAVLASLFHATLAQADLQNIEVQGGIRLRGIAFTGVTEPPQKLPPLVLKTRLDRHRPLLEHIARGLAQHLDLDDANAKAVQEVLHEILLNAMEDSTQGHRFSQDDISAPLALLLLKDVKNPEGFFTKVLSEEQIEQYHESIMARRAVENRATNDLMLTWIDQHLSLSPEQRESIHESMKSDVRDEKTRVPNVNQYLHTNFDSSVHHLPQVKLDGMLTQPQAKVWYLLIRRGRSSAIEEWKGLVDSDDDVRQERFEHFQAQIIAMHEAGQMSREEAGEAIEVLKRQLLGEQSNTSENSKRLSPEERNRQIASAKLAAHTERLGELDERAQKRLTLVSKGVVEQYLEMVGHDQRHERQRMREARMEAALAEIQGALEAEEISQEEANEKIQALRTHAVEQDSDRANWENTVQDVTRNPLYQKTIKTVLTKEAYARYQKAHADRLADRHNAMRGIAMAYLTQRLLLKEAQQQAFEEAAKNVTVPMEPHTNAYTAFAYLMGAINGDDMEGWQKQMHLRLMNETSWARQQRERVNGRLIKL